MTEQQKPNLKFFILILGVLTAIGPLTVDTYLPTFPKMAEFFGVPFSQIELSIASYFIGLSLGQLFYGTLTDRYGRKKPLYLGLLIYFFATLACAYSIHIDHFIFFRFVQALGACAGMVVTRAMVRDLFDHQESAKVFSLLMLVMGIAPIVAPLLGGQIAKYYEWQLVFKLLAGFSFLCLILMIFFLPETKKPDPTVLFKNTLSTYWTVFKDPLFLGYALSGGVAFGGMFAYITASPLVLIQYFHISAEWYGIIFGTNAFGLITMAQVNNFLLRKYPADLILYRSYQTLTFLGICLVFVGFLNGNLWFLLIPLFLFIATLGMTNPNSAAGALAAQGERAGAASAVMGTIQFIMGAALSGLVSVFNNGTPLPMTLVIGISGVFSLVSFQVFVRSRLPEMAMKEIE